MIQETDNQLITGCDAKAYIPPLVAFAGNGRLKARLLDWVKRPITNDSNVVVTGDPGTGKTSISLSYLRQQFGNPYFYRERHDPSQRGSQHRDGRPMTTDEVREWQTTPHGLVFFAQINGATDSPAVVRSKLESVMYAMGADHRVLLVDELGELFWNGLDETLRPVLTEPGITVIGTAQNFHSKRKADTSAEEDQRRSALLRRFTHRFETELPTEREHLEFLIYLVTEWRLKVDRPETLRLLVHKAKGIVGWSQRILVRAIDEPGRRLTYGLVEEADVDPR